MGYETILQISDIHIRAGDSQQSRYAEYEAQIDRLLVALNDYDEETTLVVVLGDIFHDKSKIGPSAQMLAQRLFNGLSRMTTVVIRGNHDYRQDQPDEPDLIKPFFEHSVENLHYYDETGLFQLGDVEIGLVAVQDTLIRGAAGGITSDLPPFPEPSTDDESVKHKIALFHGSFGGALLQNGTDVTERSNYPISWIKGYDLLLFGDIHVQQIHRAKPEPGTEFTCREEKDIYVTAKHGYNGSIPWAYAGSLIQQNFGESLWGHGFVEWNLNDKTATAYHVRNDVGLVVVALNSNDEPCVKFRIGRRNQIVLVSTVITYGWFPKTISLRFAANCKTQIQPIQSMFEEAGIVVRDTGFVEDTNLEEASTANQTPQTKSELVNDLSTLNSPQVWINFFTEDTKLPDGDWSQWVLHPHLLMTPTDVFEPPISTKIQDRNTKFRKTIDAYTLSRDVKAPTRHFRIHYLEFNNLLCFGQNNWLDFDNFTKTICLVNGNNGSGKSSTLEIICIALFGESFPSRYNRSYSAAIINLNKKAHDAANSRILISINGKKYWIARTFECVPKNPKSLQQRNVKLIDFDTNEVLRQNTNVVDPWVYENVGQFEHFLLTTIMSQSNDSDFFALPVKDQKQIIDSLLHLNVCEDFKTILKEAKLNHEYALSNLDSYESGMKSSQTFVQTFQQVNLQELEERAKSLKTTLADLVDKQQEAKAHWSAHAERTFHTPLQDYQQELEKLVLEEPEEELDELKDSRTLYKDRLAVLKAKRYPQVKVKAAKTSFDSLEHELQELKLKRASSGQVRAYDEQEHQEWLKTNPQIKSVPDTDLSLQELRRLLKNTQTELDTYEINEEESKPVSAKVLAGLKKQHDELTTDMDALENDITLKEKEQKVFSQQQQTKLQQYKAALKNLQGSPTAHEALLKSAQETTNSLNQIKSELDNVESHLKELGEVKYNAKCEQCVANPFRHKKESHLTSKVTLLAKKQLLEAQLKALPTTYEELKTVYEMWKSQHTDSMVVMLQQEKRNQELTLELKTLRTEYAQKEELREELEYETLSLTNEYYALKAQIQLLKSQCLVKEEAEWAKSLALVALDTQIQKLADTVAAAYQYELQTTQQELKAVEDILAKHDIYQQAIKRHADLTAIVTAYPHWLTSTQLEARIKPMTQELSSIQAQIVQATLLHSKLEQARTQAQRITEFRAVLEQRTALIKAMSDAFDKYTDWLYPTKVGPAIENAVNGVLNSISLPRPIKLVAQWSEGHFNWLVQDGNQTPPFEKCSGAQRFFISLAVRFAFSRMGASNMINAQIFLDEGFTACDAETMERVPALLSNLLKELDYLQTIFLVSHMDTLKSIATRSILIQRGAHASQLQIGDRRGATKSTATKTTVGKAPPPLAPTEEAAEGEIIEAIPLPTKKRGPRKKQDAIQVEQE
jgi:DNA repair exonuclease SbcCD ATPase subunit/predicted phosphodiesterase